MKPERWKKIEALYNAAMEHEPGRRAAFVAEACAGDGLLRGEVESLLAQGDKGGSFIEAPAMERVARDLAPDPEPVQGDDEASRKRAPWWMYAAAAAFLICAAVRYFGWYIQPEDPGIQYMPLADKNGRITRIVIRTVMPGSAAARAGLEPGDVISISSAGGFFPSVSEWGMGWYTLQTGRTYQLEIRRQEESRNISLTLDRDWLSNWWKSPLGKGNLISALMSPLLLIVALIVAFARPYDCSARWGALLMAGTSIIAAYNLNPWGWFNTILSFPRVIGWLTAVLPFTCLACSGSVPISFAAVFPRRIWRQPWIWALIWLPAAIILPSHILLDHPPIYSFPSWMPGWYDLLVRILRFIGAPLAGLVLGLNYCRLRDLNERRRIRIVVLGLAVTLAASVPSTLVVIVSYKYIRYLQWYGTLRPLIFALVWAFPISIAYAILRHRLFDMRVMIRLGVKYAAARGALLSLVPIIGTVFVGDLFLHRAQPLADILSRRVWLYALLAGVAFLLHRQRRTWLDALDRRFFREHYDAQRILRAVVDEIRQSPDFEKVASRVVSQVESALHPEFAALLMRPPGDSKYRVLSSSGNAPPSIPADSKLIGMARLLGKPLEVSPSQTGWLRQLPQQEIRLLQQARVEWLFPVSLVEGQTEALLVMGQKKSEEPYSWEDQELLQAITGSLALLLEQTALRGFEVCPECGTCYDTGSGKCRKEGANLTPLSFPRLLAHRYRFEKRLGEGGMGMVYESLDTQLGRHVAVKLIHPDLTSSPEAVARFRREAKTAASFSHPNVVTVYDSGVANDQRAFLVMELLHGSTLRQELNRQGRLPPSRGSEIFNGVCAAVDAAHRLRLLHRDLKPENIFLSTKKPVVKIRRGRETLIRRIQSLELIA
jgi:hypothetical protein